MMLGLFDPGHDLTVKASGKHDQGLNPRHLLKRLAHLWTWFFTPSFPLCHLRLSLGLRDSMRPAADHMNTKELVSLVTITMRQAQNFLPFCLLDFVFFLLITWKRP